MAAYRYPLPRRYRRVRYPYKFRKESTGAWPAAVIAGAVLLAGAGAGAKAVTSAHAKPHGQAPAKPAQTARIAVTAAGNGENAYWTATLADLGASPTAADEQSLTDWADHEGPWGTVGQWNPLDTIMAEPGSWDFNTFDGDLHVQSYPTATEGAQATAATLEDGYPQIVSALRSGEGLCGDGLAGAFGEWSGNGYREVCQT